MTKKIIIIIIVSIVAVIAIVIGIGIVRADDGLGAVNSQSAVVFERPVLAVDEVAVPTAVTGRVERVVVVDCAVVVKGQPDRVYVQSVVRPTWTHA